MEMLTSCTEGFESLSRKARAFCIDSLLSESAENCPGETIKSLSACERGSNVVSSAPSFCQTRVAHHVAAAAAAAATAAAADRCIESSGVTGVRCRLESSDLWKKFHVLGNEMIITKSGRRIFPVPAITLSGLDPGRSYVASVVVVPVDCYRYRYVYHRSRWVAAGRADRSRTASIAQPQPLPQPPQPTYVNHPGSPVVVVRGRQLGSSDHGGCCATVAFDKLKLTNCPSNCRRHTLLLQSLRKYQLRFHVGLMANSSTNDSNSSCSNELQTNSSKTFSFPETEFITVTAYQNHRITKLKIDSNPFAKGFRDSTRRQDLESFKRIIYATSNCSGRRG